MGRMAKIGLLLAIFSGVMFLMCETCTRNMVKILGYWVIVEKYDQKMSIGIDIDGDKKSDIKLQLGDLR